MDIDILRKKLKLRNQRMTVERELVLSAFLESDTDSLSLNEIHEIIFEKRKRTSKTTIKRILDIFYELEIVKKIVYSDKITRYVLSLSREKLEIANRLKREKQNIQIATTSNKRVTNEHLLSYILRLSFTIKLGGDLTPTCYSLIVSNLFYDLFMFLSR